jgi:hypothetical protein
MFLISADWAEIKKPPFPLLAAHWRAGGASLVSFKEKERLVKVLG